MVKWFNDYMISPAVPFILIVSGIFFLFRLKFFHILHPVKVIRSMFGKRDRNKDGISPIRALFLALAGTLGVGNIVGVAGAIHIGGFGAVFWMWISAFAAMLLKYAEILLAHRHRRFDPDGTPHGSAMYYIRDCFSSLRLPAVGSFIAFVFAILCVTDSLTMGCVIQINAVSHALNGVFSLPLIICGIFVSVIIGFILYHGDGMISKVTEVIVPLMSFIYIVMSLAVMLIRRSDCVSAFRSIFDDAFSFRSMGGGIIGFLTARSVRLGTIRGVLSNEAGCGTAPIAHAKSSSESAAAQGFLGIAEVFIDTILLCTMTAIVIIISYDKVSCFGNDPVMMAVHAYSAVLGDLAGYILGISILFFGFATMICWANYGIECVRYLSKSKAVTIIFEILFCVAAIVGACISPNAVWTVSDLALGLMTLINVPIICMMSKEVATVTSDTLKRL